MFVGVVDFQLYILDDCAVASAAAVADNDDDFSRLFFSLPTKKKIHAFKPTDKNRILKIKYPCKTHRNLIIIIIIIIKNKMKR